MRRDAKREPREAALVFLFGELIVQRAAAEARRKQLVEDALHVAADERDPFAGELAEAADVAEVRAETELLPGAAAGPTIDGAVVVRLHVEQQLGRAGEETRVAERRHLDGEAGNGTRRLDHRQMILHEVLVVRSVGV